MCVCVCVCVFVCVCVCVCVFVYNSVEREIPPIPISLKSPHLRHQSQTAVSLAGWLAVMLAPANERGLSVCLCV